MTETDTNRQGVNEATGAFFEGLESLCGVLNGMADELMDFSNRFAVSDEEIAELNAGKTQEENEREDAIAAAVAAPFANALDGISNIINNAAAKIRDMTFEASEDDEQTEGE